MSQSNRQPLIDMMKVVAAQLIFFHHAAIYGPLGQAWGANDPVLSGWMANYGLMAVQVFLVVAGYLAAQTLSRRSELHPLLFISRRFHRLARPLWFVLLLTIFLTALTRPWLVGDMLPAPPELFQFLAHVFLLQSALGFESLSAGVWYTAIDFQLYVIMVWLVLLARKTKWSPLWPIASAVLMAVSALWVNRHSEWDASGFYFFASYGLGASVFWARTTRWGRPLHFAVLTLMMIALVLDWRLRLCVAAFTSIVLWWGAGWQGLQISISALFSRLNDSTYLFFLLNFPVLIVANTVWFFRGGSEFLQPTWLLVAFWLVTLICADFLQHNVKWLGLVVKNNGNVATKGYK